MNHVKIKVDFLVLELMCSKKCARKENLQLSIVHVHFVVCNADEGGGIRERSSEESWMADLRNAWPVISFVRQPAC